jgi:hypothetical protein
MFYICIYLYLQSILNFVFTIAFYAMRLTKQDLSYICFKEFLNQLNLIYFYICLYLLCVRELMSHILGRKDILKFIYYLMIIFLIYL